MSALRSKKSMQKEIIRMKNKIIALVWAAAFVIGLCMILNKIQNGQRI